MHIFSRFTSISLGFALLTVFLFGQKASTPENHGIAVTNMDRSVKPGDNFFNYANGDWLKRTEIPSDRPGFGVFTALEGLSNQRTSALIDEISKSSPPDGTEARKIADLYNSYMDEAGIEQRGLLPLRSYLNAISAIKDKRELARALGESLRADVDALNNTHFHTSNLFGLWVAPDFNDPAHYTAYLLQGGLGLPDREYYLSESPHMREMREKYQAHIAAMMKLAGFTDSDARAAGIVALEHAIAEKHLTLSENEDIHKANSPWKSTDFAVRAPGLDWTEYFRGAGLNRQQGFIVWQPTAFIGEAALVESMPLETWKDWLAYHLIEDYAGVLPKAVAQEHFDFFGHTLIGTPQERPRWQRGVAVVNMQLGDAVGRIYAQRYFPPEAKAQVEAMVRNMVDAFQHRIDALSWMAPSTKVQAKAKLASLYVGIGYPETWRDYSGYEVKRDDIFGNLRRGALFYYRYNVVRLGTKVDRHQWSMTPQTVNAVNLPLQNALNFPAAILQPPFFDPQAPAAVNYGAIGTVIGHEISHTFDTEGSAFDAEGRVRNWWTPDDFAHFKADAARLVAQYDGYHPFPDVAVKGEQTIAENIADLAGLTASLDAYHASLHSQTPPEHDGFTADQQFFIAFGQNWASKSREAALRHQVLTDMHSPAQYRADEVRNVDAWYSDFDVKPGEQLYLAPPDRVRVW